MNRDRESQSKKSEAEDNLTESGAPRHNTVQIADDGKEPRTSAADQNEKTLKSQTASKEKLQAELRKAAKNRIAQREHELSTRNATYIMNYLIRRTRFDKDQIKALMSMYKKFKGSYDMDRLRFREMVASLFGITDNVMLDRIFQAFDGDNQGTVSESEWIIGLSIQLRGSLDEHIAYAYDVYDINGDRALGREEIQSCLRGSLNPIAGVLEGEELDDAMTDLVELAMKKFDLNRDGNIRFAEFRHVCRQDPLLLEAFGECLPNDRAAVPFVALLDTHERNYSCYLSRPGDKAWTKERLRYGTKKRSRTDDFGLDHDYVKFAIADDVASSPSGASGSPLLWSSSMVDNTKDSKSNKKKAK